MTSSVYQRKNTDTTKTELLKKLLELFLINILSHASSRSFILKSCISVCRNLCNFALFKAHQKVGKVGWSFLYRLEEVSDCWTSSAQYLGEKRSFVSFSQFFRALVMFLHTIQTAGSRAEHLHTLIWWLHTKWLKFFRLCDAGFPLCQILKVSIERKAKTV